MDATPSSGGDIDPQKPANKTANKMQINRYKHKKNTHTQNAFVFFPAALMRARVKKSHIFRVCPGKKKVPHFSSVSLVFLE